MAGRRKLSQRLRRYKHGTENGKPKLAMYWAAACGGCEISVLNIHEHILTVDSVSSTSHSFPALQILRPSACRRAIQMVTSMCAFSTVQFATQKMRRWLKLLRQKIEGSCSIRFLCL